MQRQVVLKTNMIDSAIDTYSNPDDGNFCDLIHKKINSKRP